MKNISAAANPVACLTVVLAFLGPLTEPREARPGEPSVLEPVRRVHVHRVWCKPAAEPDDEGGMGVCAHVEALGLRWRSLLVEVRLRTAEGKPVRVAEEAPKGYADKQGRFLMSARAPVLDRRFEWPDLCASVPYEDVLGLPAGQHWLIATFRASAEELASTSESEIRVPPGPEPGVRRAVRILAVDLSANGPPPEDAETPAGSAKPRGREDPQSRKPGLLIWGYVEVVGFDQAKAVGRLSFRREDGKALTRREEKTGKTVPWESRRELDIVPDQAQLFSHFVPYDAIGLAPGHHRLILSYAASCEGLTATQEAEYVVRVPRPKDLPSKANSVSESAPPAQASSRGRPWPRHTIDDSSRGADGVRLRDADGDGRLDVVTGWEQGGITRVYLHPGNAAVRRPWPAVTVGKTPSVEDAVLVDLDADGRMDVVTSCEGKTRTMFVHWGPKNVEDYLRPAAWKTEPVPASRNLMMWMFCTPMQVDGRHGVDLVAAGKGQGCQVGWWQSPADPHKLDDWTWHPISPAGWVMSLRTVDMDGDGDLDVLASDRKGPLRGCRWLENPGAGATQTDPWKNHFIGGRDHEVMFLTIADLDADGADEVLCATRDDGLLLFRRAHEDGWEPHSLRMPENVGTGKGVAAGDIDRDGKLDVVFSCENAGGGRSGVIRLSCDGAPARDAWTAHEISGPDGIKFDRLELLDLDADGDLDVLACEESQPVDGNRQGLGVFWYENPTIAP